jgi:hypothetical protein
VLAIHHARAMIGGFNGGTGVFKYEKNGAKMTGLNPNKNGIKRE